MIVCAGANEAFPFAKSIGVGLVESSIRLGAICARESVDALIFVGSAGSYDRGSEILSLALSESVTQIELGFLQAQAYTPIDNHIQSGALEILTHLQNLACDSADSKPFVRGVDSSLTGSAVADSNDFQTLQDSNPAQSGLESKDSQSSLDLRSAQVPLNGGALQGVLESPLQSSLDSNGEAYPPAQAALESHSLESCAAFQPSLSHSARPATPQPPLESQARVDSHTMGEGANVSQETLPPHFAELLSLPRAVVNSSNYITTDENLAARFAQAGIGLENMEFFAVMSVARYFQIPCAGLFCVSNYCNASAHKDFLANHNRVKERLTAALPLIRTLESLLAASVVTQGVSARGVVTQGVGR